MKRPSFHEVIKTSVGVIVLAVGFAYWPGKATTSTPKAAASPEDLAVIFDVGGVLIETDKAKAFWQLGPTALFSYWRQHGHISGRKIKRTFYAFLEHVSGQPGNTQLVRDPDGDMMPQLMVDWLTGTKSPKTVRAIVAEAIKIYPNWFTSTGQKKLIKQMSTMIFTPEKFVTTFKLIPEMVEIVKQCKAKGHRLFILSNFDPESFELLVQRFPDLFALFDGIIVSGYVQEVKPNRAMYEHFTEQFPANRCVFIDDQAENVQAARACGMHGILCRKINSKWSTKVNVAWVQTKLLQIEHAPASSPAVASHPSV